MNEVEKMYKLANCAEYKCSHKIQRYCDECKRCRDPYFEPFLVCEGDNCKKNYKQIEFVYKFDNEKQYKVLKLIVKSFGFNSLDKPIWDKGWDIAIAKLVNHYWNVLSNSEQQEIINILKR